jgi:hypothetical protein
VVRDRHLVVAGALEEDVVVEERAGEEGRVEALAAVDIVVAETPFRKSSPPLP